MISFEEALEIVQINAVSTGEEQTELHLAAGKVLSRDVFSDMDMPPFDKSAVDGFACRMQDVGSGMQDAGSGMQDPGCRMQDAGNRMQDAGYRMEMKVIETIAAGSVPLKTVGKGECSRIMTGGMVPEGADTVIMVEDTETLSADTIKFLKEKTSKNICYRAEDISTGQKVLDKGTLLQPAHLAVLASVGQQRVWVAVEPHLGIISTGNELVEPSQKPQGSQIRNSNAMQLYAQARQVTGKCSYLGIADDSPEDLKDKISMALEETDIVILTGGVSMGDFDYVPAAMEELGAEILFKSVAIQPGRPTVFARIKNKFIFGLPGNPVSSFVLFELMVKPFILRMMGCVPDSRMISLPMGADYTRKKTGRKSVVPVIIENSVVFPMEYHGSAHINAYTKASGMMIMDEDVTSIKKGEPANVRLL